MSLGFREAVETRDLDAMAEALAPDVVFHSPVAHTPFEGRDTVRAVLGAVLETFEDFRYTDELGDGEVHALVFRARVGDKELQGLDLLRLNDDGKVHELTVMIRPASGLMALGQEMAPKVQALKG